MRCTRPIGLAFAVALLGITAIVWALPTPAAFPGMNGLIAFWGGDQQSNPQIYVMRPNGTGITKVSQDPAAFDALPRWSPNGRQLVFSRSVGQPPLNLYRMNADGSSRTQLTFRTAGFDSTPIGSRSGHRSQTIKAPTGHRHRVG